MVASARTKMKKKNNRKFHIIKHESTPGRVLLFRNPKCAYYFTRIISPSAKKERKRKINKDGNCFEILSFDRTPPAILAEHFLHRFALFSLPFSFRLHGKQQQQQQQKKLSLPNFP